MTGEEQQQLEALLAENGNEHASITRSEANETGPLIVQFPDGQVFTIGEE